MRHLNYNHLFYFWNVAREGSIARAAEVLYLTPQTISGQIKLLEDAVGKPLFERKGRRQVLTDAGSLVRQYADEIFALGAELTERMKSDDPGIPLMLNVGIVNSIAKLIACYVIEPALETEEDIRVTCWEGDLDKLLADMAIARLDLVISDRPLPSGLSTRAYNHKLGESGTGFFVGASEARRFSKNFPQSLEEAPLLLPLNTSALRRRLDAWFDEQGIRPRVLAEFDDSALMKAFGSTGRGVFPAPLAIAQRVEDMYGARMVGEAVGVNETYYAISPERKISNPAVLTITEAARNRLLSGA